MKNHAWIRTLSTIEQSQAHFPILPNDKENKKRSADLRNR
jgi:hypothetical protein